MHTLIKLVSIVGYTALGTYAAPSYSNSTAYVASAETPHIPQALVRQPAGQAQAQTRPVQHDWLAQQEAAAHAPVATQHQVFVLMAALVFFGALSVALWRRRDLKAFWQQNPQVEQIAVLATMPLGAKQRLLLIEACGEKMLLSMNDKEVALISQLGQPTHLHHAMPEGTTTLSPDAQVHTMLQEDGWHGADEAALDHEGNQYVAFAAHDEQMDRDDTILTSSTHRMSAEALYEGAAKAQALQETQQQAQEAQPEAPKSKSTKSRSSKSKKVAMASDVAGLAHWREAAASGQGQESWGKPL